MRLFKRRAATPDEAAEPVEPEAAPSLPDPPEADANGRRSMHDQRDYLLSMIQPLPAFGMYLLDAWGTAVCEDIIADTHLPVDDLVAITGYAVAAGDIGELAPGTTTTLRLREDDKVNKHGATVAVRAGQILPDGADAVIPASQVKVNGNIVTVSKPVSPGDYVRWSGSEVRTGVPLMRSGERLDARRSALLALAGIDRVLARPRPRVVVLSVADSDSEPADVDSHLLAAAAKADGAQVWRVGVAVSSDRELLDVISDQLIRADIVIASGDLEDDAQLPRVVSQMGLSDVADVAIDPGERIGFALVGEDEIPLVMVPDDAVAAYVDYQVFVRPLIRKMMGAPVVNRAMVHCLAGGDLVGSRDEVQVRFGAVREQQGEKVVVPLGRPDNPRLADLVGAEAMIVLETDAAAIKLGERVGCWLLED